jgi:hypothetical protein
VADTSPSAVGPAANERLTGSLAAVLFTLLFLEGVTIPLLQPLLSEHIFIGTMLIPPVALKLASTGYRFARYYGGSPSYRGAGPPALLLRVIAPLVVGSTVAVLVTGVVVLLRGPHNGPWLGYHTASFVVWFVLMSIHVLAYVWRVPRLATADWRASSPPLGGSLLRRGAVGVSLGVGVVLGVVALQAADPWLRAVGSG